MRVTAASGRIIRRHGLQIQLWQKLWATRRSIRGHFSLSWKNSKPSSNACINCNRSVQSDVTRCIDIEDAVAWSSGATLRLTDLLACTQQVHLPTASRGLAHECRAWPVEGGGA
eukprot:COSAG01_NODE_10123_length_2244_cov_1.421445_4_plen_113_part_01